MHSQWQLPQEKRHTSPMEFIAELNPAPDPPTSCGHRLLTQVSGALRKGKDEVRKGAG